MDEHIDEIAWQLFTQRGYSRLKMDDLARELGISKKTLYAAIDSKEALIVRVVRDKLAQAERNTHAITHDQTKSSYDKLRSLLQYALSEFRTVQPVLLMDIHQQLPDLWAEIEATRNRMIDTQFGAVIREGVAKGEIRADISADIINTILLHSIRGVISGNFQGDVLRFAQVLEATVTILYAGIREGNDSNGTDTSGS